jgi:hypothetical protein
MRALMTALHASIADIIIDPRDTRQYERCDDLCQEIWQWATLMGHNPWGYCLDRYCSCKLMLSEWEPQTLPLIGEDGELFPGPVWAAPPRGRSARPSGVPED